MTRMPLHITTEEAEKQSLPGFDLYKYTHLLYHDALNRDFGAVRLNVEAMKAFSDTVTIAQRHTIAVERAAVKQWHANGGFEANLLYPRGAASRASLEYINYEHLKIASGFELHLKGRQLRGHVVDSGWCSSSVAPKWARNSGGVAS